MIKGIDSQIITGRTTDLMRDSSARQKGEEFTQVLNAKTEKNTVEKQTKTVTDVKDRDLRKVDDQEDEAKKQKRKQEEQKKKDLGSVVINNKDADNSMNAVSGNETVGYVRPSNLDIEI